MLEWNEGYETGIQELDDQHKKLISMYNRIFYVKDNSPQFHILLDELHKFMNKHFEFEEHLMDNSKHLETKYVERHKAEHIIIMERFADIMYDYDTTDSTSRVKDTIMHWLYNHIMKHDMRLVLK